MKKTRKVASPQKTARARSRVNVKALTAFKRNVAAAQRARRKAYNHMVKAETFAARIWGHGSREYDEVSVETLRLQG